MTKFRTKRLKLYSESSLCRNCGTETILPPKKCSANTPRTATIQHNRPKGHPLYQQDITLWCSECNNKDNKEKVNKLIFNKRQGIHYLIQGSRKGSGYYLIDDIIYKFDEDNNIVGEYNVYTFRLKMLSKWMTKHYIPSICTNKQAVNFDNYLKSTINQVFSIQKFHIGDGWYKIEKETQGTRTKEKVKIN